MTENIESLVLEHLQAIREKQAEHNKRFSDIEQRLVAIHQQMGQLVDMMHKDDADPIAAEEATLDWQAWLESRPSPQPDKEAQP